MSTSNDTFQMPTLRINDRVEVSRDATWNHTIPGTVYAVKSRGADILAHVAGRSYMFRDSMYRGDPNIEKRPHLFTDGNRGVFCLAQAELDQRELIAQMKAIIRHVDPKGTLAAKALLPKRGRPSLKPDEAETGLGSLVASQEGELVT